MITSTLRLPWMSALFPSSGAHMAPASMALDPIQANCVVSKARARWGRTKVGAVTTLSTMTLTRMRIAT
ncbi:hypothetical protein [Actinomadura madurae]|uniref:hypothetical protein n=1 Tax=Actinomadura madurae TaxID=1993 RepID=UPI0020D25A1C|nr:hypothetical protein [Actinomadura madurae]MCP9951099.1 hypothetical protein [Actinomadura madurae]MCP9980334.1 hypothetical protein [Actinomadura madurae]MCQ0008147.1 hypothetical protein [Actinomadura madurae]